MKSWQEKIDKVFAAITFAEANDHDTAREFINANPLKPICEWKLFQKISKIMTAITFAEANYHEYAREVLGVVPEPKALPAVKPVRNQSFAEAIGLKGVRVWYGMAEVA